VPFDPYPIRMVHAAGDPSRFRRKAAQQSRERRAGGVLASGLFPRYIEVKLMATTLSLRRLLQANFGRAPHRRQV